MADIKKRFNQIIEELEKNIQNKEDLEYIKSQVYNIALLFLDEIDKLAELNLGRFNTMIDREKELGKRIATMERVIKKIEEEMFMPDDCDFEIQCPYCNTEFVEDFTDEYKHEVRCPACDNLIELDWHAEDEYGCGCGHCEHETDCEGDCFFEEDSEEIKIENDEEDKDDM